MTKSIKVINCSISLNTKNSSEEYAAAVLRDWYKRASANQPKSQLSVFLGDFHKDVYLSGLFIYLLSPRLCKGLCNTIGYDSVNMATLKHIFASCGLSIDEQEKSNGDNTRTLEQYIKNIELLMKTELVGISSSMEQLTNQTAQISNQQREINHYVKDNKPTELQEIIHLIEKLNTSIDGYSSNNDNMLKPVDLPSELVSIPATLKTIQSQLASLHSAINNLSPLTDNVKPMVNDSLQKAKKIKSKKIW